MEVAVGHHCGEDSFEHVSSHFSSKHVKKYLLHCDDRSLFPSYFYLCIYTVFLPLSC